MQFRPYSNTPSLSMARQTIAGSFEVTISTIPTIHLARRKEVGRLPIPDPSSFLRDQTTAFPSYLIFHTNIHFSPTTCWAWLHSREQ